MKKGVRTRTVCDYGSGRAQQRVELLLRRYLHRLAIWRCHLLFKVLVVWMVKMEAEECFGKVKLKLERVPLQWRAGQSLRALLQRRHQPRGARMPG